MGRRWASSRRCWRSLQFAAGHSRPAAPATGADGEPRFTMLETIREYALERLVERGEEPTCAAAHAAYFLRLAGRTGRRCAAREQASWLDGWEREHDNLRAALGWALARRAGDALRLAARSGASGTVQGHLREGRAWLESGLARNASPARRCAPPICAGRHSTPGHVRRRPKPTTPQAAAYYQESLVLRRERGDRAASPIRSPTWRSAAPSSRAISRRDGAVRGEPALFREVGHNGRLLPMCLSNLGNGRDRDGRPPRRQHVRRSLACAGTWATDGA